MLQAQILAKTVTNPLWGLPLYLNYDTLTMDRFFYYEQFFPSGSSPIDERDIEFIDNENFQLTYNYTQYVPQTCSVTGIPYGTYWYSCPAPNATYIATAGTEGFIAVDSPQESISAVFQKIRTLNISINTKRNGISMPNIKCTGTSGSDMSMDKGLDKFTCDWLVGVNSNETVLLSAFGKSVSQVFPIGDYYNSQGYGEKEEGQTYCDTGFDGVYRYSYDLENYMVNVRIRVLTMNNAPISGANVLWDSVTAGGSDTNGLAVFDKKRDFSSHNITVTKVGFIPTSVSLIIFDLDNGE
jgi:hypothetical protein